MKEAVIVSAVCLAMLLPLTGFVIDGFGQQTHFGSEEEMERPIKVPVAFLNQMDRDDRQQLNRCQSDKEHSSFRREHPLDHFVGSLISFRNRLDIMVVQANSMCFSGAHNVRFWILGKKNGEKANKFKNLFNVQADGLAVSTDAARNYPDLEVFSHTAIEGFTSTYRYSRGRYRVISCYAEKLGDDSPTPRRIRCSKYKREFRI